MSNPTYTQHNTNLHIEPNLCVFVNRFTVIRLLPPRTIFGTGTGTELKYSSTVIAALPCLCSG